MVKQRPHGGQIQGSRSLGRRPVLFDSLVDLRTAEAAQSAIVVAEGYSCLGVDKSRRDTEKEARTEARRNRWTTAALWVIAALLGWLIYLLVRH